MKNTQTIKILQWGPARSIVQITYHETNEIEVLMIDNEYLMNLDELGVIE